MAICKNGILLHVNMLELIYVTKTRRIPTKMNELTVWTSTIAAGRVKAFWNLKSFSMEATPSATQFSNGLTKLAFLPDYKRPGMLCLSLLAHRKVQKLNFQSEFSMSKIIRISLKFFFIEE